MGRATHAGVALNPMGQPSKGQPRPVAKGHPGNAFSWDDMRSKFDGLVAPRLGGRSANLFELLRQFGNGDVLPAMVTLLRGL